MEYAVICGLSSGFAMFFCLTVLHLLYDIAKNIEKMMKDKNNE